MMASDTVLRLELDLRALPTQRILDLDMIDEMLRS
jgi:hypothetical protein